MKREGKVSGVTGLEVRHVGFNGLWRLGFRWRLAGLPGVYGVEGAKLQM